MCYGCYHSRSTRKVNLNFIEILPIKLIKVYFSYDFLSKIFIDNLFEEETKEANFELKTPVRPKTPPHIQENNDILANSDNNVELTEEEPTSEKRPESPEKMPIEENTNEKENIEQIDDQNDQLNHRENQIIQSEDIEIT